MVDDRRTSPVLTACRCCRPNLHIPLGHKSYHLSNTTDNSSHQQTLGLVSHIRILQPQLPSRHRRPRAKRQRQPAPNQTQSSNRRHRSQHSQLRVQYQSIDTPAKHGHTRREQARGNGIVARNEQGDGVSELSGKTLNQHLSIQLIQIGPSMNFDFISLLAAYVDIT